MSENSCSKKHSLIVFNPVSDGSTRDFWLSKIKDKHEKEQIPYQLYPTASELSINQKFFVDHLNEFTDVFVLGGDGTLHQIANCMVGSDIPIGIVPCGTGNDFSRVWYGAKSNQVHVLETVFSDQSAHVGLGVCETTTNKVYFHNILGVGFDAELIAELQYKKGLMRKYSYFYRAITKLPFYREKPISLRLDDQYYEYNNFVSVFANNRFFGGGMLVAPLADPMKSGLDYCALKNASMFQKLFTLGSVFFGNHLESSLVTYVESLKVANIDTKHLNIEADGELIGQTPCKISWQTNALRIKRI